MEWFHGWAVTLMHNGQWRVIMGKTGNQDAGGNGRHYNTLTKEIGNRETWDI